MGMGPRATCLEAACTLSDKLVHVNFKLSVVRRRTANVKDELRTRQELQKTVVVSEAFYY